MKEKLMTSVKKLQTKSIPLSTMIMSLLFTAFITLSLKSNGLFLKEILICSLIFGIALFKVSTKK